MIRCSPGPHDCLNRPPPPPLPLPPPPPVQGKTVFHKTGPWCQKGGDLCSSRMPQVKPTLSTTVPVGLHPRVLQALHSSSLKTEERAQSQLQRHPCVMDGGAYTSEARSWGSNPTADSRQRLGHRSSSSSLCLGKGREVTGYMGN